MDLSIIIPVFNTKIVEFKNCIKSIIDKEKNFCYEIIVIDDGSTEKNSIEYKKIINEIHMQNIKYIKKINGGVSTARNLGIKLAIGKYIMFLDSDDQLYFEEITLDYLNLQYDIIFFDIIVIQKKNVFVKKDIDLFCPIVVSTDDILRNFLIKGSFHEPIAKLIKKEFLEKNKIEFNCDFIQGEDALFNLQIIERKPNLYYTNKCLYEYHYDYNTAYNRWYKYSERMLDNFRYIHSKELETLKKYKLNDKIDIEEKININFMNHLFRVSMILSVDAKKYKNTLAQIYKCINDVPEISKYKNLTVKIKYFILKYKLLIFIKILSKIRNVYLKYLKRC